MPAIKTAISLPDDVFEGIDALARKLGTTRSGVIAAACRKFLLADSTQQLIAGWNAEADAMTDEEADAERSLLRAKFRRQVQLLDNLGHTWDA
jgi:metal-responsive CopG/Arc/MetJ family transcriptional regulator